LKRSCEAADTFSRIIHDHPGVKSKSGVLYPSHVESVCETLRLLLSSNKSITAIGALQSGKTTFNVALMFLAPAIYVITAVMGAPITYIPLLFTPNATELEDESLEALKNLFRIYGRMELIGTGKKMVDPMTPLKYLFKACCGDFNATMPIQYEEDVLHRNFGDAHHNVPFSVNRPKNHRFVPHLISEVQKHLNNMFEPLIIVDEVDHGAQRGSVMDSFLEQKVVYRDEAGRRIRIKLIDLCASDAYAARLVNVSATPATVISNLANVETQYLAIGPNYHGFNQCYGKIIDPRMEGKTTTPTLLRFSELAKMPGMDFFPYLNKAGYGSEEVLRPWLEKLRDSGHKTIPDMSLRQYKRRYIETMAAAINWFTRTNKGKRDDAIIRLFSNDVVNVVVKDLRNSGLIKNAHLCAWTHKNVKKNPLTTFMNNERNRPEVGKNTPIVVFVTGKARRGNPVPASVRYAVDFVWESGTQVSQQQGLLGRMCGYNKYDHERGIGNFVIQNDHEIQAIEEFVRSNFNPRSSKKKVLKSVRVHSSVTAKDLNENPFIRRGLSPKIDGFLDKLDDIAQKVLEDMPREVCRRKRNDGLPTFEVFTKAGTNGADVLEVRGAHAYSRTSKCYPLFKLFHPSWVNNSPEVSRKLMGTDKLKLYGPVDPEAHYRVPKGNEQYVHASFSWDRVATDLFGEAERVSNERGRGSYQVRDRAKTDTTGYRPLNRSQRNAHKSTTSRLRAGKNVPPLFEPLIKVVRVDENGKVVPGLILDKKGKTKHTGKARKGDKWKVLGVVFRAEKPKVEDITVPFDVRPEDNETTGRGFMSQYRETEVLA
jgi:hypothetical protein